MGPDRARVPARLSAELPAELPAGLPAVLVVCTPLLAEYVAVQRGLRHGRRPNLAAEVAAPVRARVLRTGMGPARSRQAGVVLADSLAAARPGVVSTASTPATVPGVSVVIAGVAGALTPQVAPADVVVANGLVDGARRSTLPEPAVLAGLLRAAGMSVHVGPVLSTRRPGGERAALHAETGAIAVDLESAFLAGALRTPGPAVPLAVVRVVVDTPSAPLLHPKTVPNGVRALRMLARVAALLPAWAAWPAAWRPAPARVDETDVRDLPVPAEEVR